MLKPVAKSKTIGTVRQEKQLENQNGGVGMI
jgi:hypothetical protein